MKAFLRKLQAAAASLILTASLATGLQINPVQASAAETYWKFDFGNGGVENGYTGVKASDGYDAKKGYGFSSGTSVSDVNAAGKGALSDAVQFKNATANGKYTFCADVPNGLYQVSVWLGNTSRATVGIEGMPQIINMTGNNAYHTLQVPVKDGQLNLCVAAGKSGTAFTLSALEIKQISTQTHTNPTIWICGDSTVCNYYPLDSSTQAGWAQMLPQFVDSGWQVMNVAASGQYARGFVADGQFDVIEKNGQPGDIYIISIGINDTNSKNNTTEAQYQEIITDMARRAMAKGMRVILVKQQGRNGDCQLNPLLKSRWYAGALDRVGKELGIEVVDLFNLWQDYCLKKSANEVTAMYMSGDALHPNRSGATVLAQLMADAINAGTPDSGTVTTPDPQPDPTPDPEPDPIPDPVPDPNGDLPLLQGDLNGDGRISAVDLSIAKRIVTNGGTYSQKQAIDLNGDLQADAADIAILTEWLTGKPDTFADAKYAAAEQSILDGAREDINKGFQYHDYLNLDNTNKSAVTFAVHVAQTGNYLCTFNIANGSANDRKMTVSVEGRNEIWKQSFLTTGA